MLVLFYVYVYRAGKSERKNSRKQSLNLPPIVVHIDGEDYNVSEFAKIHPGGNIIEQYDVSKVPDATDAFNTFHSRSNMARKTLASLRMTRSADTVTDTVIVNKAESDFRMMINRWRKNGLFESRLISFGIWASVIFSITIGGFYLMSVGRPVLGGIVVGIGWTHCGFVQHHAAHLAMTGLPEYDFVVAAFFESVLKGGSNRWWRNRHNKHHAMPNSIKYDGDLRTTPFFAWDEVLVKRVPTPLLRIQHLLFLPMLAMYVPLFFVTTKLYVLRKRYWDEIGLIVIHFYMISHFFTNWSDLIAFYGIGYGLQGVYLGTMFGLSHFAMPRIDDTTTDWAEWQLKSTCNWGTRSIFAEYISGFLNLQIEHHLVPQMPAENYKLVVDDVREYAKSHDLPYVELTFYQALYKMLNGLKITADAELRRRREKKAC
jgi:fatty acid desaturase